MAIKIVRAEEIQSYARIAIMATSGGGKTVGALRIAKGLGGNIAVLDTENGSSVKARKLPGLDLPFDVAILEDHSVEAYVEAIHDISKAGYQNLIIDSMSHGWHELVNKVEQLAKISSKYKNNTWSAWSEGSEIQRTLVQAITNYPGNVIATMRVKTEWGVTQNANGKNSPSRIGLAPVQGKEIEYEFDMLIQLNEDHTGAVIKDRAAKFQGQHIDLITEELGFSIGEWLARGAPLEMATQEQEARFNQLVSDLKLPEINVIKALTAKGVAEFKGLTSEKAASVIESLETKLASKKVNDGEGF